MTVFADFLGTLRFVFSLPGTTAAYAVVFVYAFINICYALFGYVLMLMGRLSIERYMEIGRAFHSDRAELLLMLVVFAVFLGVNHVHGT